MFTTTNKAMADLAKETVRELAEQHKKGNWREAARLRDELFLEADEGGLGRLERPVTDEAVLHRLEALLAEKDDDPLAGETFTDPEVEALYWAVENVSEFVNLGPEE